MNMGYFMKNLFKMLKSLLTIIVLLSLFSCSKQLVENETTTITNSVFEEATYAETEAPIEETTIRVAREIEVDPLRIKSVNGYRDTEKSTYIEIEFSKEIEDKFDAVPYINIEPSVNFTSSKVSDKLILNGDFSAKNIYKVTIQSGIRAKDGSVTDDEFETTIAFDQKKPKLVFSSDGIILPSVNDKKVYVRSLNVKRIYVNIKKVYANNTTQFLQSFDFSGNGKYYGSFYEGSDNYDEDYYYDEYDYYRSNANRFSNVGDTIYEHYFDIDNEIDSWVQTAIDLTGILDANGIYLIDVCFDKDGTTYSFPSDMDSYDIHRYCVKNGQIAKTLLLTDIGIIADKSDDGFRVNVLNINDNRQLRGVKVYLMSKNNQILEEKNTDTDGVVNFSNNNKAYYILAENGLTRSILMLKNALNTNGFSVDGAYASNGIKGYIYTERGVYRPGDPVYTSIIARNNDESLLDNQPVTITIYDPSGTKVIENDVVKNGVNGFYTYSFKTETSSKTGIWKLEATIGDQKFKKDISIETVVPNKIKVTLNTPDTININESMPELTISSNYLFGEPTSGNEYSISMDLHEAPIDFPKYKDYTFKSPSSYGFSGDYKSFMGNLDNNGMAKFTPDFKSLEFGSVNLVSNITARVEDDGGRNVTTTKYMKIKKYDTYIGIENTNTYKLPGSKLDIKAICVSEDGENLIAGKNLKYKIYGNNYYWWWDYSNYDKFIRSFKSDKNTKLLKEGNIISKDVPVLIEDDVPESEYIFIELIDESTGQVTGVNIQSSEWVDPSVTKKIETLNVSADKKKYEVGDFATIKFKGAKEAKAIITLEKSGKIIDQYYRDVNSEEFIEQIRITKDMAPNIYVYVSLLQNYNKKDNDRPMRLYGIVPINVEDEDTKIDIKIDAPNQIKPNEKFNVKIKNQKNKKFDFTIAVVDEGLLDITAFETPSPWKHFFQKLAAKLVMYDNYSEIIDRPYGAINQILKVGGDESLLDEMARRRRLKELGLEDADRFTPISMYKGVLTSDANGEANVEFEMPSYMGSVRIMVIAANGNSYGSAEKNMLVKAPIILLPTLPRSMKVGDKVSVPVSVFAIEEGVGNVEVYYRFRDKYLTKTLNMKKGDKEIVYFDDEIPNEVFTDKLTVGVKSAIYNYEETVGMAVNSNSSPIIVNENKTLKGKSEVQFLQDKEFVKGTVDSVLTISNREPLGIDKRLKYLIKYPYGCIEQTTSSVFPQLFIDKLSSTNNYDKEKVVDNINAGIARLQTFQLKDGSFSYWPGNKNTYKYATNYVGHFMIYAKKYGYYVPDSMYNNWIKYVEKEVKGTNIRNAKDLHSKCYSLYLLALSGKPNVSEMNYIFERYFDSELMYNTSKMYLASAYKLAGEDKASKNISSKINKESIEKMYNDIIKNDQDFYDYNYGSKLCDIAVYLDSYFTIYGTKDENAYNEVLNAMRYGDWYSTQDISYSLLALANFGVINEQKGVSGKINIDGEITPFNTEDKFKINIKENAKSIKVISESDNNCYVSYYWEGIPINEEVEDYSHGFTIERNYYDNDGFDIDPKEVKSGDTFWLEVIVKPTSNNTRKIENIALTQILPSGWEIENTRLNGISPTHWVYEKMQNTNVDYTDIRDDRIMWFFDYRSGRKDKEARFYVKINAVTKGEFDFPGTTLEAMYDNNYRAFKKGTRVKVK